MTREEIAIELTKLYVENNNMTTTRETRYTTIYKTMLDNIKKEEKSDAQLEIEKVGYEEFYRYYKEKEATIEQL